MTAQDFLDKRQLEVMKSGVLSKFPFLGATMSKLDYSIGSCVKTAGTDGKNVYFSRKFIENLTYEEKIFLLAHEVMHVAFEHIKRKNGKEKKLWNKATDAVINQLLISEGLPMIKGGVDIPKALKMSSDEVYKMLEKEKEENKETLSSGNLDGDGDSVGHDDHDIWDNYNNTKGNSSGKENSDNSKENETEEGKDNQEINDQNCEGSDSKDEDLENEGKFDDLEKNFKDLNNEMKNATASKIIERLNDEKDKIDDGRLKRVAKFSGVGESKSVISWKTILRREMENEVDRLGYRRASEENDFSARIDEVEIDDYPETEVMLDVSGSVSDNLLKGFLRQLKPLLKESKLKVGCFDEYFYGLQEIKTNKDIDNFKSVSKSGRTENWDLAVRSFSKKRGVNKIVFTDGYPCPGVMPKEDLKKENVKWFVFGNDDFKPCCGKVIYVDRDKLKYESEKEDFLDFFEFEK